MMRIDGSRIALIGGTGFIGSTLAPLLVDRGASVLAVGRCPSPGLSYDTKSLDVGSDDAFGRWIEDYDGFVYLASYSDPVSRWRVGPDNGAALRVNVDGFRKLLAAVARSHRPTTVVLASSIAAAMPPFGGYALHKRAAEKLLEEAASLGAVRGAVVRLPTVYGAGTARPVMGSGVVATFVRQAWSGRAITLWGDGTVRRSLLHVDDAARALIAALEHADSLGPRPFAVGPRSVTSLVDIASSVVAAVNRQGGRACDPQHVPMPEHAAPSDLQDALVDASAFERLAGWTPHTTLRDGLEDLVHVLDPRSRPPVIGPFTG